MTHPVESPVEFMRLLDAWPDPDNADSIDPEPGQEPNTTRNEGRQTDGSFVFHDGSRIDAEADPQRWPPTQADPPRGSNALWCMMYRTMIVTLARSSSPHLAMYVAEDAERVWKEAAGMRAWAWDVLASVGRRDMGSRPPDPRVTP